jgi:fibrillarin-like rRNA methylase
MADPEGKAKLDAFLACEATVKAIGEQIANAFQREAKELQQKVIADLALQTRAENIRRGNEQRAKFAAAVEEGFREAARRSGW